MSDLLNSASLVMIPSGYKEDVVYSQIPTDGSGDLSFTRASNGTRINSAGLVEVCPWNLAQYSEDFTNGVWSKSGGATITSNNTTAPNGTLTADKIDLAANIYSGLYQLISQPNGIYANSIYAKAGTFNYLFVLINGASSYHVWFNLSTGTIGSKGTNMDGTIESVGDGWYRCTASRNLNNDSNTYIQFGFSDAENFLPTTTGNAYIWGAQANIGSTAKPYFPTTDRLNVPRLTYQNGGGGCPSLLLEKQSTNLFTYSEQIDNAAWFYNNLTITANQAISPDGTQNADLLDDGTASSTQHWIYQGTSFSNSTAYTISFYAKYVSRQNMTVNIYNGSSSQYVAYNIQNGTIVGSTGDVTASITSVGNGWYKIVYTRTMAASGSPNFRIGLADDTGSETYTGSNKQVYVWGFQCEASSYPTSYIPTTSSSATRVADECRKAGISSLIGTEFTAFVDFNMLEDDGPTRYLILKGSGGTYENFISIEKYFGTQFIFVVTNSSGANQVSINGGSINVGQRYKIAIKCKNGDYAFYINGVQIGTSTASYTPSVSLLDLHYYDYYGQNSYNQVALFSALTNAEIQALTTL